MLRKVETVECFQEKERSSEQRERKLNWKKKGRDSGLRPKSHAHT